MGSSALCAWRNHADPGKHELLAAGGANDDVERPRPKSTGRSDGLRRLQRHYNPRRKFFGTVLPRACSLPTSPTLVSAVLAPGGCLSLPVTRVTLGPSSAGHLAPVRAVRVSAEAAVADDEERPTSAATLDDDVK